MRFTLACVPILCLALCASLRAEKVTLEKPVQVSTLKADRKPLDGKVVAYDEEGFDLVKGKDKTIRVKWSELAAPGVYNVKASIAGPKATGEQWINVGRDMLRIEGGEPFADKAFARAVKLDPKLQAAADEAREAGKTAEPPTEVSAKTGAAGARDEGAAVESSAGGPQMVGKVQDGAWPALSESQRAQRVAQLKTFAEEAAKK